MHQFKQLRLMLDPPPTCRLNMETQRLCMVGGEILSCYSISYLSRLNGVASTHTHAHAHAHAHTHRHRHRHTDTHVWTTMKCMATACRAPRRAEGGQGDHAGDFIRNFHIQHKSVGLHQILIGCSFGMEWGDGIHTSSENVTNSFAKDGGMVRSQQLLRVRGSHARFDGTGVPEKTTVNDHSPIFGSGVRNISKRSELV